MLHAEAIREYWDGVSGYKHHLAHARPRYTKPPKGGFFVPAIYASHQVVSVSPTHHLAHSVQSLPHHIAPSERCQLPSSVPPTKRAKFKPSEASYLAACRLRRKKVIDSITSYSSKISVIFFFRFSRWRVTY